MPDEAAVRTHDAVIVVYSVTDAGSFGAARGLCLRISEMSARRPVIVVANKCDLVRLRKVSSKGQFRARHRPGQPSGAGCRQRRNCRWNTNEALRSLGIMVTVSGKCFNNARRPVL